MSYHFPVTRTTTPKAKPDQSNLGFGKYFTDHMFIMDYDEGQGWHDGKIVPYGPISLDPASCVLHYAQMMFEGMKAYLTPDGKINLFRPDMNAKRLNRTNERMCIPFMDEELFIEAVKATVRVDADWIPSQPGTALYIRPYIISDEVSFSVEPSKHYHFIIILCAVGAYYDINRGGLTGSHIYVEDEYIRAAVGGTGFAKVGGNYAGGMRATKKALENGCLILNVGGVDGNAALALFGCLVDAGVVCVVSLALERQELGDSGGQGGLTMVNVADGADVDVGFASLKFLLGHWDFPP